MTSDAQYIVAKELRVLEHRLHCRLRDEYEYLTSDEIVDRTPAANMLTLTVNGRHFG